MMSGNLTSIGNFLITCLTFFINLLALCFILFSAIHLLMKEYFSGNLHFVNLDFANLNFGNFHFVNLDFVNSHFVMVND
jgi:hypothetical protein